MANHSRRCNSGSWRSTASRSPETSSTTPRTRVMTWTSPTMTFSAWLHMQWRYVYMRTYTHTHICTHHTHASCVVNIAHTTHTHILCRLRRLTPRVLSLWNGVKSETRPGKMCPMNGSSIGSLWFRAVPKSLFLPPMVCTRVTHAT